MWLKIIPFDQLFVVLLLVQNNVMPSSAANMAQLKNQQQQQQTLGHQASTTSQQQQQQQQHLIHTQIQHQLQHQIQPQLQQAQQQQQPVQPGIAAHPINPSGIHGSNGGHHNKASSSQTLPSSLSAASSSASTSSSSSSVDHSPQAQFVNNDKEATMQEVLQHFNADDDLNDPYQILNELKRDTHSGSNIPPPAPPTSDGSSNNYPWNLYERPYVAPASHMNNVPLHSMAGLFPQMFNPFETFPSTFPITPRFMPIMSYPQPIYVPYPFIMAPEMFYPGFSPMTNTATNEYEDAMSRGAGTSRRPSSPTQHTSSYSRNSPIYYVRLPPTPYMFLPSLGLGNPSSPMSAYPAMMPYQSLPSFPSFSSIFNVPINFLANGKPNNIYQMSAPPNEMQNPLQFANIPSSFNTRPPPPPPPNTYRPSSASHNYFNSQPPTVSGNYGSYSNPTSSSSSSSSLSASIPSHQDSKLTSLKRPYYFNGRPEDIYILPNNFNHLYSSKSSYY